MHKSPRSEQTEDECSRMINSSSRNNVLLFFFSFVQKRVKYIAVFTETSLKISPSALFYFFQITVQFKQFFRLSKFEIYVCLKLHCRRKMLKKNKTKQVLFETIRVIFRPPQTVKVTDDRLIRRIYEFNTALHASFVSFSVKLFFRFLSIREINCSGFVITLFTDFSKTMS